MQQIANENKMQENFPVFFRASLLFALGYVFCLYDNPAGITYPLFIAGAVCYFRFTAKQLGVTRKKELFFYETALFLLGLSIFCSDSADLNYLTKKGILLLFLVYLLHGTYEDRRWDFFKYIEAGLRTVGSAVCSIPLPFSHFSLYRKTHAGEEKKPGNRTLAYILLGAFAALPLLLVTASLLSSADAVFQSMIKNLLRYIRLPDLSSPFSILFTALYAFFLSYCLTAAVCKKEVKEDCPAKNTREPIPAVTAAVMLLLPYLLFCGIQIIYLFVGKGQLPDGFTYAEYARRGFFQLLFVCILNLFLVVTCTTFFQKRRSLQITLMLICTCTYIMLLSSAWRMLLYIQSYGLTFLRILVLWSLAVIAVLMAGVLLHIFRQDFPLFRFGVAVVTLCYILLAFAHPDYLIARYNVSLAADSGTASGHPDSSAVDLTYLSRLSADAAPVLLSPELPQSLREATVGTKTDAATYLQLYKEQIINRYPLMTDLRRLNLSFLLAKVSIRP